MKIDIYNTTAVNAARAFHSHQTSQPSSVASSPLILKKLASNNNISTNETNIIDGTSTVFAEVDSSSVSPAIHYPDEEIHLSTLSYRRLVHESKESASLFCQKACYAKQPEFENVAFYVISPPAAASSAPSSETSSSIPSSSSSLPSPAGTTVNAVEFAGYSSSSIPQKKKKDTNKLNPAEWVVTEQAFIAIDEGIAFIESNWPVVQSNKESLATLLDLVEESGCENLIACVSKENPQWQSIVHSYLSVGFRMDNSMVIPGYLLLSHEM